MQLRPVPDVQHKRWNWLRPKNVERKKPCIAHMFVSGCVPYVVKHIFMTNAQNTTGTKGTPRNDIQDL